MLLRLFPVALFSFTFALGAPSYRVFLYAGGTYAGDGGPAVSAHLGSIEGIARDHAGNTFLADSTNHQIRIVSPTGVISTAPIEGLKNPYGIVFDRQGNLYVADHGNSRVLRMDRQGKITTTLGPDWLKGPRALTVDFYNNLYVADSTANRVLRIDPTGKASIAAEGLNFPSAIAADYSGNIYTADAKSIRVLNSPMTTDLPATPTALSSDVTGELTVATAEGILYRLTRDRTLRALDTGRAHQTLRAIFLDGAGTITLSEGPRVYTVTSLGQLTPLAGTNPKIAQSVNELRLQSPMGLALDSGGALYIADEAAQAIRRIALDGTVTTPVTGADPVAVAVSPLGEIAVADYASHQVRVRLPNGVVYTAAGTGAPGTAGESGPAQFAQLNRPRALAYNAQGELYIADNDRVTKLTRASFLVPIRTSLKTPAGLAVDSQGQLWIADSGNNRILGPTAIYEGFKFPTGITSVGGGIVAADTYNHAIKKIHASGTIAKIAELDTPTAVAADPQGRIYTASSNRIYLLTPEAEAVTQQKITILHAATLRESPLAPGQLAFAQIQPQGTSTRFRIPESLPPGRHLIEIGNAWAEVDLVEAAPAFFPLPSNRFQRGATLELYATGLASHLPTTIRIGNHPAEILWQGDVPDTPGVTQINIRLPGIFSPPGSQSITIYQGAYQSPPMALTLE